MLQGVPDMTQREIVEKLSISTSSLNCLLKALIDEVLLAGRFLKRMMTEPDQFIAEIEALKPETACLGVDNQKAQNA